MNKKQDKQAQLHALYQPYKDPLSCPFGFGELHNTVFGEGDPESPLMFIGEAPGRDEDLQARPFVGRSGQLLTRIIEASKIKRQNVFITNVVKWRPPNNRQPTLIEMEHAKSILLKHEIAIIRPRVICTLGASALHAMVDPEAKISAIRGKAITKDETTIVPTYHPAYILRNNKELENFMNDIFYAIKLAGLAKKD